MIKIIQEKRLARFAFFKIFMACLLLSLTLQNSFAQTAEKKWNLGLMAGFNVYNGDYGNSMRDFRYEAIRQNPTAAIHLSRYLFPSFDVAINASFGSYGYYFNGLTLFKGDMLHANLNLRYKLNNGYMLSENSRLAPYLFFGAGIANFTGDRINNGQDYPVVGGLGIRYRISTNITLNYQATYGYFSSAHYNPSAHSSATGNDRFMLHMLGIGLDLGASSANNDIDKDGVVNKLDKCPNTPADGTVDAFGCLLDTDLDGVSDYLDKCPELSGSNNSYGCPDKDGDGVLDSQDECPEISGIAAFNGCPDTDADGIEDRKDKCPRDKGPANTFGCPDADNDGVPDNIDKCITVAGNAQHSGCPDTDNDGIYDDIDMCRTIPGIPENYGCPEIEEKVKQLFQKALQGIRFETGKAIIKPESFAILNAIVKVMEDHPDYKLIIGGHTDNVGDDDMNYTLSKDRAAAVSNYLITKGVSPLRVSSDGFGETKPVDTNDSENGRTRNRRVEFKVEFLE
jgi:outer membrane protein OmpA-like peptidoglycan-associated protein